MADTPGKDAPVLLSGGNPQIAKGYGEAPVQAWLVAQSVPGVRKAVKWNSPLYGVDGETWFLSLHCFTRFLRVTFFRGTGLLPPPQGLSKYPAVRYLDIPEGGPEGGLDTRSSRSGCGRRQHFRARRCRQRAAGQPAGLRVTAPGPAGIAP